MSEENIMKSIFQKLEELDLKDVIDAQFKIQVDAPWPREAECLEYHGLKDARSVLDIGTGNGYFMCRLAERYPEKRFTGIEVSEELIAIAQKAAEERGLANVSFVNASCPLPEITGSYDFALARLALYCAPKRKEIMSWVHGLLDVGGRMVIVEVDVSQCYSYPKSDAWDKLFTAVQEIDHGMNSDPFLGRKLPHLLLQAGFGGIFFEQKHWFSSIGMTPDEFVNYWLHDSLTLHRVCPDQFTKEDLERFRAYIQEAIETNTNIAMCPVFIASGVK